MTKFIGIDYLKQGTERQRSAYICLKTMDLLRRLSAYQPILAGTIPIDIDIPTSDLDIICASTDLLLFERFMREEFGLLENFQQNKNEIEIGEVPSLVTTFRSWGFTLEIFCQSVPSQEQNAYIHMIVEDRILGCAHPSARSEIRRLKSQGMKTEPAFAKLFNLPGDPYEALLKLRYCSEEGIQSIAHRWRPQEIQ